GGLRRVSALERVAVQRLQPVVRPLARAPLAEAVLQRRLVGFVDRADQLAERGRLVVDMAGHLVRDRPGPVAAFALAPPLAVERRPVLVVDPLQQTAGERLEAPGVAVVVA